MSYALEVPVESDTSSNESNTNKKTIAPDAAVRTLTNKQQQKQDAMELAEHIYAIFNDGLSSATMNKKSGKDGKNA